MTPIFPGSPNGHNGGGITTHGLAASQPGYFPRRKRDVMRLVGSTLVAGGLALLIAWPSNGAGVSSMFIVACGLLFLGWDEPAEFDALDRERVGL